MKYLIVLLLLFLVGCRTPQDLSPAPINNNKMTQELSSCGKQEVGLLGCFYNENQSGSLVIPLWYRGEYQIQSERCGYFQNERYDGSQRLEISYQELLASKPSQEKTCLYNIKVFIDKFDNGFEAFFLLDEGSVKPLQFHFMSKVHLGHAAIQVKEGTSLNQELIIDANTPGALIWTGCKSAGEKRYIANPKLILKEVMKDVVTTNNSCILTIGLIPEDVHLPVQLAKLQLNIFEKTVVSLSTPTVTQDQKNLKIEAEKIVAAIAINDYVSIKSGSGKKRLVRRVNPESEVDVRVFTSNGRFLLLKVKNGSVLWVK